MGEEGRGGLNYQLLMLETMPQLFSHGFLEFFDVEDLGGGGGRDLLFLFF